MTDGDIALDILKAILASASWVNIFDRNGPVLSIDGQAPITEEQADLLDRLGAQG